MSGTLTLAAGQVFTGGTSLSDGDTGAIALTEVGTVSFDTAASPPTISDVDITQDAAASSVSSDGLFIQSVTIDSVTPDSVVTLTTDDLPPGVTVPSGFTLPQNVQGTTLGVTVVTNEGTFDGTAGLYGENGPLALVAVQSIDVFGFTVNAGAAILSLGEQTTGDGLSDNFTPAFTAAPFFAAGTLIRTPGGDVPVEALRAGDLALLGRRRRDAGGMAGQPPGRLPPPSTAAGCQADSRLRRCVCDRAAVPGSVALAGSCRLHQRRADSDTLSPQRQDDCAGARRKRRLLAC